MIANLISLLTLRGGFLSALALLTVNADAQTPILLGPWSGGITPTTAEVRAKLSEASGSATLVVSTSEQLDKKPQRFPGQKSETITRFLVNGLTADTTYHYGVEVDGVIVDEAKGKFHTFPDKPASFRFAFASCAETGSNHEVFRTILKQEPLFYLNDGDLHYQNIKTNDRALFRAAFAKVLGASNQAALYRQVPLVYMWDDHDFGPDGSDSTSLSREAAALSYREYIPHYPLPSGEGAKPIYHAFSVGRARFIVTDLRSERTPQTVKDSAEKTLMGAEQKAWFKKELLDAKAKYPVIFWVSTVPWVGPPKDGDDKWWSYMTERKEIANFLADNGIDQLVILSGDTHMLAADDGTNSNYSDKPGPGPRALVAAPLDRSSAIKGGPFSQKPYGAVKGEGCFGLVMVEDRGSEIAVTFSGRNHLDEEKVGLKFTLPAKK